MQCQTYCCNSHNNLEVKAISVNQIIIYTFLLSIILLKIEINIYSKTKKAFDFQMPFL